MHMYLLCSLKEFSKKSSFEGKRNYPTVLFSSSQILPHCAFFRFPNFQGLEGWNVGLRPKPPQEQTVCLAHINTWLIIIATESILKKIGVISF